MSSNIKYSRLVWNIILFNLYWFIPSVIFSFVFPVVLKIFGQAVLNPNDPVFVKIQIAIIVLMLVISLVYRKYFYLPVMHFIEEKTPETKKELELEHDLNELKEEEGKKEDKLDIKIGREIK